MRKAQGTELPRATLATHFGPFEAPRPYRRIRVCVCAAWASLACKLDERILPDIYQMTLTDEVRLLMAAPCMNAHDMQTLLGRDHDEIIQLARDLSECESGDERRALLK